MFIAIACRVGRSGYQERVHRKAAFAVVDESRADAVQAALDYARREESTFTSYRVFVGTLGFEATTNVKFDLVPIAER